MDSKKVAAMNSDAFKRALAEQGYADVETKSLDAGFKTDPHDHPFDVRAWIIDGEIDLIVDGKRTTYAAGTEFNMDAGCEHQEHVGPNGVTFIIGRHHR